MFSAQFHHCKFGVGILMLVAKILCPIQIKFSFLHSLGINERKIIETSTTAPTTCDKSTNSSTNLACCVFEPSKWSESSLRSSQSTANSLCRQSSTITQYRTTTFTRTGSDEFEFTSISQDESTEEERLVLQRPLKLLLDQSITSDLSFNVLQLSTTEEQELVEVSHFLN